MKSLRALIRYIILENSDDDKETDDLLTEPDESDEEPEQEASVSSGVAGVTTPLGTGPTYPDKPKKKRLSPAAAAGKAFGNAKPAKFSR
jgi:hypothetical protein